MKRRQEIEIVGDHIQDEDERCERGDTDRPAGRPSGTGFDAYLYPNLAPPSVGDPGLILAWPIIALIDYFHNRSAAKKDREIAAKAVNDAIADGTFSGSKFNNAVWLTFGWAVGAGKYGQYGEGVQEVRDSIVKKVRAGDPKAIAFYKAALKSGYTPSKKDPGLAQLT